MKKNPIPRFKAGDILVDGRGWEREIVVVLTNYLGIKGRFGYHYNTEDGSGHWRYDWFMNLCSQEHMLSKGYKLKP